MQRLSLIAVGLLAGAVMVCADTHYVRSPETCTNTAAQHPYASWENAATNIQWAMDAAAANDTVLVSNGAYRATGAVDNVVAFEKNLTLVSVNGPGDTVIDGQAASRCVWLRYDSALDGFTLSNGFAACGAGVYMQNCTGTVTNCWMVDNVCTGVTSSFIAGAGIALDGGNPLATDCRIWNNECLAGDAAAVTRRPTAAAAESASPPAWCSAASSPATNRSISAPRAIMAAEECLSAVELSQTVRLPAILECTEGVFAPALVHPR